MAVVVLYGKKQLCFGLYLLTAWLATSCNAQTQTKTINGKECTVKPQQNISLVAGWPLGIPCFPQFQTYSHADAAYDWCETTNHTRTHLQCLATNISRGEIILNASRSCFDFEEYVINFDEVFPTGQPSLEIAILADTVPPGLEEAPCEVYNYAFLSKEEPSTCRESADAFNDTDVEITAGEPFSLTCRGAVDDQINISATFFSWLHNCMNLTGNQTRIRSDGALEFSRVDYEDAGIYICVASYNGRKRYFPSRACVRPTDAASAPTITCVRTETEVDFGQNVTLTCTATFGPGIVDARLFSVFWHKSTTEICVNARENETVYSASIGCNYFIDSPFSQSCITSYSGQQAVVTANLILTDVQNDDLGDYVITVRNLQNLTDSEMIRVTERPKSPPVPLIAGLVVGIALLIIIVFILLYVFRFYVKVYWKRWFGAYEQDIFRHEAYISYYATVDLDRAAMNLVRDATTTTIEGLKSLGFQRLYDKHGIYEFGFVVEVVMNAISESHRIVIILSPEYIRADEAISELQQAVTNNMKTGKKIIFILLPGTRDAVEKGGNKMIKRMIDTCHAIQWSTGDDFDRKRFRFELEYAMPKLRRENAFMLDNLSGVYENGHALPPVNGSRRGPSVQADDPENSV